MSAEKEISCAIQNWIYCEWLFFKDIKIWQTFKEIILKHIYEYFTVDCRRDKLMSTCDKEE